MYNLLTKKGALSEIESQKALMCAKSIEESGTEISETNFMAQIQWIAL